MSASRIKKIFELKLDNWKEKFILISLELGCTNIPEISKKTFFSQKVVKKYIDILIEKNYVKSFDDSTYQLQINYSVL